MFDFNSITAGEIVYRHYLIIAVIVIENTKAPLKKLFIIHV